MCIRDSCVPDKDGTLTDVVLGYDDLASYEVNGCFFGSTIGRNGNRIGGAKFSVNGKEVVLAQNEMCIRDSILTAWTEKCPK